VNSHLSFELQFEPSQDVEGKQVHDSLSAVEALDDGATLFLGNDETVGGYPAIERLRKIGGNVYGEHTRHALTDFIDLPDPKLRDGALAEVDLEGFAECDGYLWFVGSYSCRRRKPKEEGTLGINELARVENGKNRALLGRIPLVPTEDGMQLARKAERRRSATLSQDLRDVLREDPLLGPFLRPFRNAKGKKVILPGKDNGFDVEGLAAVPGPLGMTRLFVGLRGPVVRGYAVVLELWIREATRPTRLELCPFPDRKLYRRHLLPLEGLGIRDLCVHHDDLWILAGPTMTLRAPQLLFSWSNFLQNDAESLIQRRPEVLTPRATLEPRFGFNNAEGLAYMGTHPENHPSFLVVYDAPSTDRCVGTSGVRADVLRPASAGVETSGSLL
jgi:hypothetical protein